MKSLNLFIFIARATAIFIIGSTISVIATPGYAQNLNQQQSGGVIWGLPVNISRTPNSTSTDPFLLADPAGLVHLFWGEKTSKQPIKNPDTLMYARWDGSNWSQPIDIFFSPEEHGNQIVQFPHAALDANGIIHLVWMTQPNFPNYALFYSSVPANKANNASAWNEPITLAEDLTGTNYALDIKTDAFNNIHIIYARVPSGDNIKELRSITYIKSEDGGITWSEGLDIYTIPDTRSGASNNRLIVDEAGNLYTSWSEWDQSGNGQAIYFSRSLDNGDTWEPPVILAERQGNEYERDWNSLGLLEENHLVSFYEGGWRAYRNVMYSDDGGQTWTEPVDAFPGVIGENGFVEFARDGADTLHIFFANRTREGNTLKSGEGLWHSVWQGGEKWSEPILSSPNINMLNPKAVIINGNQVIITWYTGADLEIMVMAGKIVDAPYIPSVIWPETTPTVILDSTLTPTIKPNDTPTLVPTSKPPAITPLPGGSIDPGISVSVGIGVSFIILLALIGTIKFISQRR